MDSANAFCTRTLRKSRARHLSTSTFVFLRLQFVRELVGLFVGCVRKEEPCFYVFLKLTSNNQTKPEDSAENMSGTKQQAVSPPVWPARWRAIISVGNLPLSDFSLLCNGTRTV